MDPIAVVAVAVLVGAAMWLLRGLSDERRARRAQLERLLNGHRIDLAIEAEREIARRKTALEEANSAWSSGARVIRLDAWRKNGGDAA